MKYSIFLHPVSYMLVESINTVNISDISIYSSSSLENKDKDTVIADGFLSLL